MADDQGRARPASSDAPGPGDAGDLRQPVAAGEAPGARWQRLAALWRGRLQPVPAPAIGLAALQAQRRAALAPLEEIRRRVRQVTGRAPLGRLEVNVGPAPQDRSAHTPKPPVTLDLPLQRQLERFLRLRLPRIELHTSVAADRAAARVGADAVTAGRAVYFRRGAFQPQTAQGMGLLAHEATHIAWRLGARPARAAGGAEPAEEAVALANERRLLTGQPSLSMHALTASAPLAATPPTPSAPPAFVQTAMASRDVGDQAQATPSPGAQLAPAAAHALKAELYGMLLDNLRSEFERGA